VNLLLGGSTITLVVNDGRFNSPPATVADTVNIGVTGLQPPMAGLVLSGNPAPAPHKAFEAGETLPLKLRLSCGASTISAGVAPPQIVALLRNGTALNLAVLGRDDDDRDRDRDGDDDHAHHDSDSDRDQSHDGGLLFRVSDGQWINNLKTDGLKPGSYIIALLMPDGRRYDAAFVLR
jgi:hypothetical protein